jgi:hypothetical protein
MARFGGSRRLRGKRSRRSSILCRSSLRPDVFESSPRFAGQLASVLLKLAVSCPLTMIARRIYNKSCYKVLGLERWWEFGKIIWDYQTDNNEQARVNFGRVNYISVASSRSPGI